jgi:hypothetical protein
MTTELYFPFAMTIALAPGKAVEIKAGEVLALDDALAAHLTKRSGVIRAQDVHKEARRIAIEGRLVDPERAARLAPPVSEEALLRDFGTRKRLAALRAEFASAS